MRVSVLRTLAVGAVASAFVLAAPAVMALSGDMRVHLSNGSDAGNTVFTNPQDVYIYGTGMPQGEYYVHIRNTQSNAILGASNGASDPTPVVVGSDGKFADLYQVWSLVEKTSDGSQGFDLTGTDWTEYRVCVSSTSTFEDENTVTDLFLLEAEEEEEEPATCAVKVTKFYDANANGQRDSGEASITGWEVDIDGAGGFSDTVETPWSGDLDEGTYTFTEGTPTQKNWVRTTVGEVTVDVAGGEEVEIEFGNLCLGGKNAVNPCGWLSKYGQSLINSGDLTALCSLNLVDPFGCSYNPSSKTSLYIYLFLGCVLDNDCYIEYDCSNMAFLLSVHEAAMTLSVRKGLVDKNCLVYAPGVGNTGVGNDFITVVDLLKAADAAIKDDGYTPPNDDDREYQAALKDALERANNNRNFVQASAGTFSF